MKEREKETGYLLDIWESIQAKLKENSEAIAQEIYLCMHGVSEDRCIQITDRFGSLAVMNVNCRDR